MDTTEFQRKPRDSYASRGAQIMQMADRMRGPLREWLKTCRMTDGRPVPPEQAYGIALAIAQRLTKSSHS